MNQALLLMGLVIFICILLGRFMEKIPLPSLLIFIGLGMLFGENGVLKIFRHRCTSDKSIRKLGFALAQPNQRPLPVGRGR